MKLIIEAKDINQAIEDYVNKNYGMTMALPSNGIEDVVMEVTPVSKEATDDVEDDREWAETRANELGINFRSDIKTSTLITRIEEMEEELAKQAKNPDPLPMDEPEYEETQYEEVQEEVTETEEAIEDEPETEEKPVQSKKPSIFDTKR